MSGLSNRNQVGVKELVDIGGIGIIDVNLKKLEEI
jgi:hypothetical protein